jgi:ankyrin repeat protein
MDERFHPAQDALARGDVAGLAEILDGDPSLASARSGRSHPTLLQYLVLTKPPVRELEPLIEVLASRGAELNDPLIAAASMDNPRAIVKLLDLGANIEGNGRWSPLEEALYWNHASAVTLLLDRGARVNNLRTAAALGDLKKVARCFDGNGKLTPAAGVVAWPFFRHPIAEAARTDPNEIIGNVLVYAAAWNRKEVVDFLLARGAQVNRIPAGFDYAGTALHYAALEGHREMVDHLLSVGADPAIRDTKVHGFPEGWADHGGHPELAAHLKQVREKAG